MAKLVDPNEKAPSGPDDTKGPQPPMEVPSREIPKEGVTAGDLALEKAVPDPQKDPIGYMIYLQTVGFESVHKRLNQQGELIANMAEKVYGPQGEGAQAAAGVKPDFWGGLINGDTINKFLDLAKAQLTQGDPRDARAIEIGYRILNGAEDVAMKQIYRSVGREAAGSITHVG